jgi:dTDP-4-amino-4,6-dideoxygalactose transaminase
VLRHALSGLPGITLPSATADRFHVYYQYCVHLPDRDAALRACLRRGLDVECHHMDVCPDLPLFADEPSHGVAGARRRAETLQLPVHASLSAADMQRVATRARAALETRAEPSRAAPAGKVHERR